MNDASFEELVEQALHRAAPRYVPLTLEMFAASIPETVPVPPRRILPSRVRSVTRTPVWIGIAACLLIVALTAVMLPTHTNPAAATTWQPMSIEGISGGTVLQVVSGPAGLLAVGVDDPLAPAHPRIWASTDGRHWRSIHDADAAVAQLGALSVSACAWKQGWVVTSDKVVWTSEDGSTWTRSDLGELVATGVAASADRIVAVGFNSGNDVWSTPGALTSTDGRTWTASPTFARGVEFGVLWGVKAVSGGFLAFGEVHETGTLPADDSPNAPELQAVGVPWFSEDGSRWTRVTDTLNRSPFANSLVTALVAGGPGYVAIGHDTSGTTPIVWTSADARSWARVTSALPFGHVNVAAVGLGGSGRRLVAFVEQGEGRGATLWNQKSTTVGGTTEIWQSADGVVWETETSLTSTSTRLFDVVELGSSLLAFGNREAPGECGGAATASSHSTAATTWTLTNYGSCNVVSAWILR